MFLRHAPTSCSYAIIGIARVLGQVLERCKIKSETQRKFVRRERETMLACAGHPFVLRLSATYHDARTIYFLLELVEPGCTLFQAGRQQPNEDGSFSEDAVRFYICSVISALVHLGRRGVVHRDLKVGRVSG